MLAKLFKAWKISHLVFEKDTDAYARQRDEDVIKQAEEAGVEVIVKMGRTLYDPDELVKANGGKPTMSITQVQHVRGASLNLREKYRADTFQAAEKLDEVAKPVPTPESLPDPGNASLDFEHTPPSPKPDFNDIQRIDMESSYTHLAGPEGDFGVPTLSELGLKPATTQHRGGETLALRALDEIISNKTYTATFAKPATAPTAFDPQSTTLLSPHHHFGSLSVRLFYWRVMDVLKEYKGKQSTIPTNLIGQLLFRDMYFGYVHLGAGSFQSVVRLSHKTCLGCKRIFLFSIPVLQLQFLPRIGFADYEICVELKRLSAIPLLKHTATAIADSYPGISLPKSIRPMAS